MKRLFYLSIILLIAFVVLDISSLYHGQPFHFGDIITMANLAINAIIAHRYARQEES